MGEISNAHTMNAQDVVGLVFCVLGVLLLIPTVYVSWVFVLGVAILVSLGIFIIIEMGEMLRHTDDVHREVLSEDKALENAESTARLPALNVSPTGKV